MPRREEAPVLAGARRQRRAARASRRAPDRRRRFRRALPPAGALPRAVPARARAPAGQPGTGHECGRSHAPQHGRSGGQARAAHCAC